LRRIASSAALPAIKGRAGAQASLFQRNCWQEFRLNSKTEIASVVNALRNFRNEIEELRLKRFRSATSILMQTA
jgi:hypothetical protein